MATNDIRYISYGNNDNGDNYSWDTKVYMYDHGCRPAQIEDLINNSYTASSCLELSSKYIYGKGFGSDLEVDKFVVNYTLGSSIAAFAKKVIHNYVLHNMCFVKANYGLLGSGEPEIVSLSIINNEHLRFCWRDDIGYISHVAFSQNWAQAYYGEEYTKYSIYNPNVSLSDLIGKPSGAQWDSSYLSKLNSSGVVYVLANNNSEDIYPKSRIYPVLNECVIEHKTSIYKKNALVSGFLGKILIVVNDGTQIDLMNGDGYGAEHSYALNKKRESGADEFKNWLGADGVGGVLTYWSKNPELDQAIKVVKIESDITPDLFTGAEESAIKNISSIFYNTPIGLLRSSEAMFGNSGEAFKQMKLFLQENTEGERQIVHSFISGILAKMPRFSSKFGELQEITPLISITDNAPASDTTNI